MDPHGQAPRSRLLSLLYFCWHILPFLWGWWRYVKPVLFRNGLVIIDRYYYDFFVDQRRYRLNLPQWVVKTGYIFVKKPDLVFCLDADPEILQARKKEVSFEECTRQREAYRSLAEKLPNGHVVDASQPSSSVAVVSVIGAPGTAHAGSRGFAYCVGLPEGNDALTKQISELLPRIERVSGPAVVPVTRAV